MQEQNHILSTPLTAVKIKSLVSFCFSKIYIKKKKKQTQNKSSTQAVKLQQVKLSQLQIYRKSFAASVHDWHQILKKATLTQI